MQKSAGLGFRELSFGLMVSYVSFWEYRRQTAALQGTFYGMCAGCSTDDTLFPTVLLHGAV